MSVYEIELKALLKSPSEVESFLARLRAVDRKLVFESKEKQLNHYFVGGEIARLGVLIHSFLEEFEVNDFHHIVQYGLNISVRTRETNQKTSLIIKATLDNQSSDNGGARLEFEKEFTNISLDQLDQFLINSGYVYQAKWSRERSVYLYHPYSQNLSNEITVCLDKNAGYGYVVEFEKLTSDITNIEQIKAELKNVLINLGLTELSEEKLNRMFQFYNQHWQEYFGTDKVFDID